MSEGFVLKNSKDLQMKSVRAFMRQLGYTYLDGYFVNLTDTRFKDKFRISFITAIRLHNGTLTDWHGLTFFSPFDCFSVYEYKKAQAAKIVEKAHLQYSKKEKRVIVTQHLVKFVHPAYYNLFKGMLK